MKNNWKLALKIWNKEFRVARERFPDNPLVFTELAYNTFPELFCPVGELPSDVKNKLLEMRTDIQQTLSQLEIRVEEILSEINLGGNQEKYEEN